ncbi:hypothetical protein VOLCADRAFT_88928 [Volvox carteri f. nagariensis]|uniref:Uncharacterized protein n=1 Tax=Volvox carteri f. nagariensis TaxID=3068 RepID=D8TQC0_VOLCA|nr:uncharacterized protein VOLCADRAFT_88928 [Volvox carteri f. nagariensis]EFJ50378.1 hypothetical protein VOLCADRAFT_88928 [Volvox carteri f. nagariensis]|eukprot:XP_002948503.1 hypothetical protein VOLCADRAFT_88928 [Volvox carteri f. nagariensis]
MPQGNGRKSANRNKENCDEVIASKTHKDKGDRPNLSKPPAAGDHVALQPVDLDRERLERMQRNEKILQDLGLVPMLHSIKSTVIAAAEVKKIAVSKKRKRDSNSTTGEERVLRRSLRTKGEEPELPPLLKPLFHRLRTLSDEAMRKRIQKITNTLKLKSLVQLLTDFGRDELAEEAQRALDARLANV